MNAFVALLTALALQPPPATGPGVPPLGPLDAFEMEYATDVQIAPDGQHVLFVRNSADVMTDERVSSVWVVSSHGGAPQPVGEDGRTAAWPRWSPSGDRIAYVSAGTQLIVRWVATGDERVVTTLTGPLQALAWSPNGETLAFVLFTSDQAEAPSVALPSPPPGADWKAPAYVTDRLYYRVDGAGVRSPGMHQLFVVPADGGTPRNVSGAGFTYGTALGGSGGIAWTADASELIVTANLRDDPELAPIDTDLYAYGVDGDGPRRLTRRAGPDFRPRVSPDGSLVAYVGFDDRLQGFQTTELYVVPIQGGEPRLLSHQLPHSIADHHWAPGGDALLVSYDEAGITRIARLGLDGSVSELSGNIGGGFGLLAYGADLGGGGFTVADDGSYAAVHTDPWTPGDVAVATGINEPLRTITALNADVLDHRTLGRVETVRYPSSRDGMEIEGWIIYPPDFDASKRYPLIVEIHGGPFANYGPRFDLEKQLMAAHGYVVLYTNPRGSTSYGEAFANAIHHDFPGDDYLDIVSGVDALLERGFIDPERLYVAGGSGGGMITTWIIGATDRFRAAAVHYPVIEWVAQALTSDGGPYMLRYWFGEMPWENPEAYVTRSPLYRVGAISTPTLVLSGEVDVRTPVSQAEMLYMALRVRGVESVLVRVPDEPHGSAVHPSHQLAKVLATVQWFDRHGGAAEPGP